MLSLFSSLLPHFSTHVSLPSHLPDFTLPRLGMGQYGLVYPTHDPAVVFKYTTDPTEAAFVRFILSSPALNLRGLATHHSMLPIPPWAHAIWREAVTNPNTRIDDDIAFSAITNLEIVGHALWRGQRTKITLAEYKKHALRLAEIPKFSCLSHTLIDLYHRGVLLCDINERNLGEVERDGMTQKVIFDPGECVFL